MRARRCRSRAYHDARGFTLGSAEPSRFPIAPPIEPMLAKIAEGLPNGDGWVFEPKWDGFRALVYKDGGELYIQSRDLRPLDRYFPELHDVLASRLPARCVVDGEIVIVGPAGLDFDLLQLRLHPAASRVAKLAAETPASFVAFDLLALDSRDLRDAPLSTRRRAARGRARGHRSAGAHHADHAGSRARRRLVRAFRGRRARRGDRQKRAGTAIAPGSGRCSRSSTRAPPTAPWRDSAGTRKALSLVGSLLLGLYDEAGALQHVGVTSSFTMARRRELAVELEPLRRDALAAHPWRDWAGASAESQRMPGAQSRWTAGKVLVVGAVAGRAGL